MAMNRIQAPCSCCNQQVELFRDQISGSDHYRCGNCFELFELDDVERLLKLNDDLKQLEEKRHALFAAHGFDRGQRLQR